MSETISELSKTQITQSLSLQVVVDNSNSDEISNTNTEMGEKTKKHNHDVTGKSKKKNRAPQPIKEGLTTVAHCCVFGFVSLIVYLCFKQPFEFFTWHPLLLSLGWMLLMSEAILVVSKENILTRKFKVSHTLRLRLHWVCLTVGALLIASGFLVITISKNRLNKNHYTSWHGLLGLLGIITYIPPCINGTVTLYSKELRNRVNGKTVKLIHVITGTLCFTFGGLSLILSVYTKWFMRRTEDDTYMFLFGLFTATFSVVWVMQRPLIKAVKNVLKRYSGDEKEVK